MKYLDEFRDIQGVQFYLDRIQTNISRPWRIMEICGGQTHSIMKNGLNQLLSEQIQLLHGPGCPVCVTPEEKIDQAIEIALQPGVILCSYGDMVRVPGSRGAQGRSAQSLLDARALGAEVRVIYSPTEAVTLAEQQPDRQVVLFAIGFETTAPGNAAALLKARQLGLTNFFMLASMVTVPAAMEALLEPSVEEPFVDDPAHHIDGFLAAGHVCTVMGYHQYHQIAEKYQVPIVITGFEPVDILKGIDCCVAQLEAGEFKLENAYRRYVTESGNGPAQQMLQQVFQLEDQLWRGIGLIPKSGLGLRASYQAFDAQHRFADCLNPSETVTILPQCQSGLVMQGKIKPDQCPSFGKHCSPEHPLGAPMVSSEGACAAYYRYAQDA